MCLFMATEPGTFNKRESANSVLSFKLMNSWQVLEFGACVCANDTSISIKSIQKVVLICKQPRASIHAAPFLIKPSLSDVDVGKINQHLTRWSNVVVV